MIKKGFTLIEILVAMGVGSILLFAVFGVVSEGSAGVKRVTHSSGMRVEGREGLTQLARDLVGFQRGGTRLKSSASGEWRRDRFEFLARFPKDAQDEDDALSTLCQVVYEVRVDRENVSVGGAIQQNLYRKIIGSKDVVENLLDSGGLINDKAPEKGSGPVAFGVVHFQVDLLKPGSGGLVKWLPDDKEAPVVGEVTIILANDEIVSRMKKEQDWDNSGLPLGTVREVKEGRVKGLSLYQMKIEL